MLLGIPLGLLGVDTALMNSAAYGSYQSVINFITAPTGMLIMITIGYGIELRKDLMKPVAFTALTRLVTSAVFCVLGCLIIFHFMPFDKTTLVALIMAFALPTSYAIPLFAKFEGHKDYVSTTISFETIIYLLCFIGITIYATA